MESEIRRRKTSSAGDQNPKQDKTTGEYKVGISSYIDSAFTYLILLVLVALLSVLAVTKYIPDHPLSLALLSLLDLSLSTLGLCPLVYGVK